MHLSVLSSSALLTGCRTCGLLSSIEEWILIAYRSDVLFVGPQI